MSTVIGSTRNNSGSTHGYTKSDEACAPTPLRRRPRIGRNEPCPCNSGKKYKKCHLKEAQC